MAKTDFLSWDWASQHVQVELENGEYVSAESTLILVGPPTLSMIQGKEFSVTSLFPMGLIQNIQIAQNRQVARLFEIGSKRSYFVPGRLFANFQLNRILFYGPSLLRLLYALAPSGQEKGSGVPFSSAPVGSTVKAGLNKEIKNDKYTKLFPPQYSLAPGKGAASNEQGNRDFWINLASDVFNVPMGLCLLFKDARQRAYGAFYMENCMIEAHSLGVDSNNVVLAEGVNGQFDMVNPIQVQDANG